jgi:hypothetical protein
MCSPPPRTQDFRFRAGAPPSLLVGVAARAPHPICLGHSRCALRAGDLLTVGVNGGRPARAPPSPVGTTGPDPLRDRVPGPMGAPWPTSHHPDLDFDF